MRIKAKLKGDRRTRENLRRLRRKAPEAVNAAVFLEALRIFEASQPQVPVDTGRLRASGVVAPGGTFLRFKAVIGYGTDYALAVHERVEVPHRVGKAKYLEDPFRAAISGMLARIARDAQRFVDKGNAPPPRREGGSRTGEDPG